MSGPVEAPLSVGEKNARMMGWACKNHEHATCLYMFKYTADGALTTDGVGTTEVTFWMSWPPKGLMVRIGWDTVGTVRQLTKGIPSQMLGKECTIWCCPCPKIGAVVKLERERKRE